MIRKPAIALLAVVALAATVFGLFSAKSIIHRALWVSDRHVVYFYYRDSEVRLFWLSATEKLVVTFESNVIDFIEPLTFRAVPGRDCDEVVIRSAGTLRPADVGLSGYIRSTLPGVPIDSCPTVSLRMFRTPIWTVPAFLIAYPIFAFIRGPMRRWRRRRRGVCAGCGYNLTGNESGVCPECGNKIEKP